MLIQTWNNSVDSSLLSLQNYRNLRTQNLGAKDKKVVHKKIKEKQDKNALLKTSRMIKHFLITYIL